MKIINWFITLELEKYGFYFVNISTFLISHDKKRVYALAPSSGALPPGNYTLEIEVTIPKEVNPGKYRLLRVYRYTVGKNEVVKFFETPLFEVVS